MRYMEHMGRWVVFGTKSTLPLRTGEVAFWGGSVSTTGGSNRLLAGHLCAGGAEPAPPRSRHMELNADSAPLA